MASAYGIQVPFDKTGAHSLVLEIVLNAPERVQGTVIYPSAFFVRKLLFS